MSDKETLQGYNTRLTAIDAIIDNLPVDLSSKTFKVEKTQLTYDATTYDISVPHTLGADVQFIVFVLANIDKVYISLACLAGYAFKNGKKAFVYNSSGDTGAKTFTATFTDTTVDFSVTPGFVNGKTYDVYVGGLA